MDIKLIIIWFAATCFAQIPDEFLIQSQLDGKILAVAKEYAPPAGGEFQRLGVMPVDGKSNVETWRLSIWIHPNEGALCPLNFTKRNHNMLTEGLLCADCYTFIHGYNVSQISEDGDRLLRLVDGISETNSCVKNAGEGHFITEVKCDESDNSLRWRFVEAKTTTELSAIR